MVLYWTLSTTEYINKQDVFSLLTNMVSKCIGNNVFISSDCVSNQLGVH